MDKHAIQWLFFDLGSTLVDETEAWRHRLSATAAHSATPISALRERMEQLAKESCTPYSELVDSLGLPPAPWYPEGESLYPETLEILSYFHQKYSIGIIANQTHGTRERVHAMGMTPYIDCMVTSDELGVSKPNPQIFSTAIQLAKTTPEQSVMIGDRVDNDIRPSKAMGFHTIWIRQGFGGLCPPQNEAEQPDDTINSLSELKHIL